MIASLFVARDMKPRYRWMRLCGHWAWWLVSDFEDAVKNRKPGAVLRFIGMLS